MPKAGYIWWEDEDLHYIDEVGAERKIVAATVSLVGFTYTFDFFFSDAL